MAPNPTSLTRAQYSGLDFDTHLDDLRARLQTKYGQDYNDFATSSLGIMLLDLAAFGLDTLSFYLDRRATDTFLATARTRRAVAKLARQLGYKMRPAVSSSTDLTTTIPKYPFNVVLPKGFKWKGPNELVFETAEAVFWASNEDGAARTKTVPVYEGETMTESFTSDGTAHQTFELRRVPDGKFIVAGSVTVLVAGAPYNESDFLTFDETNQFEIGYNDDPPTLRFGDGVAGVIPPTNASIVCTYVASRGRAGLVTKNTITKELNPLVVNFQAIKLTVTNPEGSIGGEDPEDLAHAKVFAPKVWKSRDVAVVGEDYEALAGSFADPLFGRVAVAQAVSSRSAAEDIELQQLLDHVRRNVDNAVPVAGVEGDSTTALRTGFSSILDRLLIVRSAGDSIVTKVEAGTSALDSISGSLRGAKNGAIEAGNDASNAVENVTAATTDATNGVVALRTKINAMATGGADSLTSEAKTSILAALDYTKSLLDIAKAQAAASATAASIIQTTLDNQLRAISTARDGVLAIGQRSGAVYEGDVADLMSEMDGVAASIGSGGTPSSGLLQEVGKIEAAVSATETLVLQDCADIETHVDRILSADSKANLVTVPILARDAAGFFTTPSVGLIRSLQQFLDVRKEVTQTVIVVDGSGALVRAVVTARVGVARGYAESVTRTAVNAAIESILRERRFGVSLYVSDIIDAIKAVDGVSFTNVVIGYAGMPVTVAGAPDMASPAMKLDGEGNLILAASEVITKGNVTVNVESA